MSEWRPIETAPKDAFILLYDDGMMRCGMWEDGKWTVPEFPVLIDKVGNRLVSRQLEQYRGERMELSWTILEPTHWMPLPLPPRTDTELANIGKQ